MEMNIFQFKSFNTYLNDWVKMKRKNPNFSLGTLVRDLELNSIAEIANILKGRRKISQRVLSKFLNYIELSELEKYYLQLLAEIDRNQDNEFLLTLLNEKIKEMHQKYLH